LNAQFETQVWLSQAFMFCVDDCDTVAVLETAAGPLVATPPFAFAAPPVPAPPAALPAPVWLAITSPPTAAVVFAPETASPVVFSAPYVSPPRPVEPPWLVLDVVEVDGLAVWVAVKLPFVLLPPFADELADWDVESDTGPAAPPVAVCPRPLLPPSPPRPVSPPIAFGSPPAPEFGELVDPPAPPVAPEDPLPPAPPDASDAVGAPARPAPPVPAAPEPEPPLQVTHRLPPSPPVPEPPEPEPPAPAVPVAELAPPAPPAPPAPVEAAAPPVPPLPESDEVSPPRPVSALPPWPLEPPSADWHPPALTPQRFAAPPPADVLSP
jgi:hypothetical protein